MPSFSRHGRPTSLHSSRKSAPPHAAWSQAYVREGDNVQPANHRLAARTREAGRALSVVLEPSPSCEGAAVTWRSRNRLLVGMWPRAQPDAAPVCFREGLLSKANLESRTGDSE